TSHPGPQLHPHTAGSRAEAHARIACGPARVAKLVDARDLKSLRRKAMRVRPPPRAPAHPTHQSHAATSWRVRVGWIGDCPRRPGQVMKPAPFKLERYFASHEFSAAYLLCSSDCESMEIGELLALEPGAYEDFSRLRLGYTESTGNPDLRRAIATLYTRVAMDEVLVHAGAEEAIFNFMHVALEAGDQVIVHSPYYQSLGEVARALGAEVSEWRGNPEHGWALDIATLKQKLTPRTRVVVVNFPHNPTGFIPGVEFIRELSALAEQHGFIIFSDEVYRGLEADPADRLPAVADLNARAVSLGVMSKTYGLPG